MIIANRCALVAATIVLCFGSVAPATAADEVSSTAASCRALTRLQQRIVDKSNQGMEALRGFVWMTKFIHGIDMYDVARSLDEWRAAAACSSRLADAASQRQ